MSHESEHVLEPTTDLNPCILVIRGQRVILDVDLARLYGVTTSRLNEQVTRNRDRFPSDFVFRLQQDEKNEVIANCDILKNIKYSKVLPRAFTEHGALMAASVLNSPRAVEMSIYVVRAFVRIRSMIVQHEAFSHRLSELECQIASHDESIRNIVTALRELLSDQSDDTPHPIGFRSGHGTRSLEREK